MRETYCPSCAERAIPYIGNSEILILGEKPGDEEIKQGRPFASNPKFMTAGQVFRKELQMVGLSFSDFRIGNLWLHEPTDNKNCYKASYDLALEECKDKKAILLVGSDVVETFTKYKVSDVCGLQVDSALLSCPIIYALINPAIVLHGRGLGEIRLGIQKFAARLKEEGLV